MSGEATLCCPYCGVPVRRRGPCSKCKPLHRVDPLGGGMVGRLSERELGLVDVWPAGELEDDGAQE
jgi:hypothetical protein